MAAAGGARGLLEEMDKKAQASPVADLTPEPPTSDLSNGDKSPKAYAGKFDPKAIAKKAATSSHSSSKLGTDIALPDVAKASAISNSTNTSIKADTKLASVNGLSGEPILTISALFFPC